MKVLNYVLLDNNNILEISSPNNLNNDDYEYFLQHMTKTSDNILDLVEVGDLVEVYNRIEQITIVGDTKLYGNFNNGYGHFKTKHRFKAIYKKQSNGDFKKYKVEEELK